MNRERVYDALTDVRDEIIEEATERKLIKNPRRNLLVRWCAVAASLMIVVGIGSYIFMSIGGNSGEANEPAQYQKITPEAAKAMMDAGGVIILDVRTEAEFAEAHIENAILIPDTDIIKRAPNMLTDKKQAILVYCRAGVRSERASNTLIELGYTNVYDFGGIIDWPYPIVTGAVA